MQLKGGGAGYVHTRPVPDLAKADASEVGVSGG